MPRRCILLADSMASAARLSLCKESTVTSLRAKSTTNKVWVLLFTSFNVLRIAKMPCKSTLLYAKLHRGGVLVKRWSECVKNLLEVLQLVILVL